LGLLEKRGMGVFGALLSVSHAIFKRLKVSCLLDLGVYIGEMKLNEIEQFWENLKKGG